MAPYGCDLMIVGNLRRIWNSDSKFRIKLARSIYIFGFLCLLILIASTSYFLDAEATTDRNHVITSSKDAVYNTDLFFESFDYGLKDHNIVQDPASTGEISTSSSELVIEAGDGRLDTDATGKNLYKTRPLFYDRDVQFTTYSLFCDTGNSASKLSN